MLDRLTPSVADMEDVDCIALNREQNPVYVRRVAVEKVAHFKRKYLALRSQRTTLRKFPE